MRSKLGVRDLAYLSKANRCDLVYLSHEPVRVGVLANFGRPIKMGSKLIRGYHLNKLGNEIHYT